METEHFGQRMYSELSASSHDASTVISVVNKLDRVLLTTNVDNNVQLAVTKFSIPTTRLCNHPLRGVDSVQLQILLMGTCRQYGSWSVAGHNHRKVIGRDPNCAS